QQVRGVAPSVGGQGVVGELGSEERGKPCVEVGATATDGNPVFGIGKFACGTACGVHHPSRGTAAPDRVTSVGPPKLVTGGGVPTNFSISTRQVLALGPWASLDVP